MNTNDLIERLAKDLAPVKPWRPGRNAAAWLAGAALYVAALALIMPDRGAGGGEGMAFLLPQLAALATAVLASIAAFVSGVPGYGKRVLAWPALAAVLWLATLAAGAPAEPRSASVLAAQHEWLCVSFIVLGGAPLVAALAAMLRRGAPLEPATTGALAGLAVGSLGSVGACLSLPHASNAVTLVWHGGAVAALVLACAWSGRFVSRLRAASSH